MSESLICALLGGIVLLSLIFYARYLQVRLVRFIAFGLAFVLALVSFLLNDEHGFNSRWLLLPLFFLIYFQIFRFVFIGLYKYEPILDRYAHVKLPIRHRKMHFGDMVFTVFVFGLPFITTKRSCCLQSKA